MKTITKKQAGKAWQPKKQAPAKPPLNEDWRKIYIHGYSLLELREMAGLGDGGFYDNNWWLKEDLAKEKPQAGYYEINFAKNYENMTYDQQEAAIKRDGFTRLHPAIIAEGILTTYLLTGERLLENWYHRSSVKSSDGYRVYVGDADARGLHVKYLWDDDGWDYVGVAASRKV